MDLHHALDAHAACKLSLQEYIDGRAAERLDPVAIGRTDCCELGRWISKHHDARKHLPEWRLVRERHADYHRCAAEIVALVHVGDTAAARQVLRTDHAHVSAMVVKSIRRLTKALDVTGRPLKILQA